MPANEPLSLESVRGPQINLRIVLLALSMIGILAVGATVEIFRAEGQFARHLAELERSIEERAELRRLFSLLQRGEAAQRGYLLTNDPAYEALFLAIQRSSLTRLEQLPDIFADTDNQLDRTHALVALVRKHLAQLTSELEEHNGAGQSAGRITESDGILGTMTGIGRLVDQMIAFEEEQIRTASRSLDDQVSWSRNVIIVQLTSILILVSGVLWVGLIHLSRRGRIELQLREAMRLADRANQEKSEFLASMSHEIRTPLTSILGYAELLLDEGLTEQQREFVEHLQISSAGLLALVNDIFDFSKIEAGEVTLEREPLSLGAVIADVMSIVSMDAHNSGIRLAHELDPALPKRVTGDAFRLRKVLLNLLSNAVKFTEKGSVTLRVRCDDSSPAGELIRFEVHDTGIGIPRDQQQHLFRQFSQLDSSMQRRYGGTGLGLVISRRLVELMGGEIGVESEEGKGSTFWYVVPLPRIEGNGTERVGEPEAQTAAAGRILLVEDSPQNQDLVNRVLTRAGHQVDIAGDGEEALAALDTASYDLILMDLQMPRMDGLTATRRIREGGGPARDVPIIAMSANVLPQHLREFREAGANDHIAKPFRIALLIEKVGNWLAPVTRGEERDPSGAADLSTYDPATLEEARSLMGEQWIRANLTRLEANIGTLLASDVGSGTSLDVAGLERRAHQIVADAGQLGFPELSRRTSELEQACRHEREIVRTLEQAHQAGRFAVTVINGLLEDAGEH